jgi:hypothetical protein
MSEIKCSVCNKYNQQRAGTRVHFTNYKVGEICRSVWHILGMASDIEATNIIIQKMRHAISTIK